MKVGKEDMTEIWHAFGNFIARQIRSGKGVGVPKFGNFTFTAQDVDLAVSLVYQGTTNPMERDR
jgi:nucleoid DNA-binding protein